MTVYIGGVAQGGGGGGGGTPAAHAPSHLKGASDQINGDQIAVALIPDYYTPLSDTLSGHLHGIDHTLSGLMVGNVTTASNVGTAGTGVFKQKVGVDLEFKKVNAASVRMSVLDDTGNSEVKLDVNPGNIQHNALSGIGTDDHHAKAHNQSHLPGGADPLVGDAVGVVATPSGYTPTSSALSGHLEGIGTALTAKAGLNHTHLHNNLSGIGTDDHHAKLHNTTHMADGVDPINTDLLTLAVNPAGYTRDSTTLSGHLTGISTALTAKAGLTHTHLHNNLSGIGTDDHHAKAHNQSHLPGGDDPLVGDAIGVVATPSGYTPSSAVLSGHLEGIGTALTAKAGLNHAHIHDNLSGIGTDNHHAKAHNQSHLLGGEDPLVGDALGVAFAPLYYTPTASTLSGHLKGIDNTLSGMMVGDITTASNVGTAGVGVFKQKAGVNLEFKKVNAASTRLTVLDDTGNSEVKIDANPGNIQHNALSGIGTDDHHAKAHNQSHIDGGSDLINTDLMTLAVNPAGYTRDSTALSGHLTGISTALTAKAGLTHTHLHNNLSGIGTDDHHAKAHNQSHLPGGDDKLVGDAISVAYTPSNYTAAAATLSGHLAGIDTKLAAPVTVHNQSHLAGGTDAIDTDLLGVTVNPSGYTRDSTALSGHLTGISNALTAKASLTHTHLHNNLSGIGANDHHNQLHNQAHLPGGGDPLVGDDISVAFSATNYAATSTTLSGHLAGINTKLGAGVTPLAHNQSHIDGGSDLINTDLMTLTVNPSGYTRDSTALSGHLTGISNALTARSLITHVHQHNNLSGIGANDHHPQLHNQAHLTGGGDPINGALLPVSYTPVNYTAVSSVLSGHLSGIDAKLASVGVSAHNQSHLPGGTDPLVGDAIGVSFSPTNYTKTSSTLSGHLAGINTKLATVGGGVVHVTTFAAPYNTPPIAASGNGTFNISGVGLVGLSMQRFQITPAGAVSSYCVEMFRKNTFLAADQQYLLSGVTDSVLSGIATLDELVGQMYDDDSSSSLHVKISNFGAAARSFAVVYEGTKIDS